MRRYIIFFAVAFLPTQHVVVVPAVAKEEFAAPKTLIVQQVPKPKPTVKLEPREIAKRASRNAGFNLTEWRCLDMLWTKESHFNPKARNKRSGAYGIAQFMPQTWKNYKVKKTSDPHLQIKYGLRYIIKRYGSPCAAWNHSKKRGWY